MIARSRGPASAARGATRVVAAQGEADTEAGSGLPEGWQAPRRQSRLEMRGDVLRCGEMAHLDGDRCGARHRIKQHLAWLQRRRDAREQDDSAPTGCEHAPRLRKRVREERRPRLEMQMEVYDTEGGVERGGEAARRRGAPCADCPKGSP